MRTTPEPEACHSHSLFSRAQWTPRKAACLLSHPDLQQAPDTLRALRQSPDACPSGSAQLLQRCHRPEPAGPPWESAGVCVEDG